MDSGLLWSVENNFALLSLPQGNESDSQDGQLVCKRLGSSSVLLLERERVLHYM